MSTSQPTGNDSGPQADFWHARSEQQQKLLHRLEEKRKRLKAKSRSKVQANTRNDAPYTPFFIPDELLNSKETYLQSQSLLASLPTELFLLVLDHLSIPYFQVSLGLTCKSIAAVLAQNRGRLSPWRGYCDKEGLYRLLTRPERVSGNTRKFESIPKLPSLQSPSNDVSTMSTSSPARPCPPTGSSSQPFIPPHLRLCRACFRHVPRDPLYWRQKILNHEFDSPGVSWYDISAFFQEIHRDCGQHKCPDCCRRKYIAFMNLSSYEEALKEDERDAETGYDLDGVHGTRRVCPELVLRLSRP